MTQKAFYDWQTAGGGGDVTRLVSVKRQWQPTRIGWLAVVVCLLFVSACRAPMPEAGRYEWVFVPRSENSGDQIHVIDTVTGEVAQWNGSSWSPSYWAPLSTPDWNDIRKQREKNRKEQLEKENKVKEAREKREALVKSFAQMPLAKQVAWANEISILKYKGKTNYPPDYPPGLVRISHQGQPHFEHFETLKKNGVCLLNGEVRPYKATDADMVVYFDGTAEGIRFSFSLSHTPIDDKAFFPAPATIIDDVKAEVKRQAEQQKEAHAENH